MAKKPSATAGKDAGKKETVKKESPSILTAQGPAAGSTSASAGPSTTPAPGVPPVAAAIDATDISTDDDIILTDAEGRRYCRATDCDQIGSVDGYCRYHYLFFWKKIQNRKKILADGKLDRYVEELTARYADKFLEMLRKDLRTEKDFMAAIQELELDDSAQSSSDDSDDKTYLEEIRGMADETGARGDDDTY